MQIAAAGSLPSISQISQTSRPETTERGPDHDHDGDGGQRVTASSSLPAPTAGRGASVDIVA